MKIRIEGKGSIIHRKGGTFSINIINSDKNILYRPFIQFSLKDMFWYPKFKRMNDDVWYVGWLFAYVGLMTIKSS